MEAHGLALANDERGCLVALRESEQAFAAAEDRNDRGRLFNVVLLASVLVDQRQVEEACDTGLAALGLASDVRSARTDADLADLSQRLTPFQAEPAVQSLNEQIRALLQRAGGA